MAPAPPDSLIPWRIVAEQVGSCNCDWGCPCQFYALPTHGYCEALEATEIIEGFYGDTSLAGVRYAQVYHWDGPVHEGDGWRRLILDRRSTAAQRGAIETLTSGAAGHPAFEIFAAMTPHVSEPLVASIELSYDRERRRARILVAGIAESQIEPIRNMVTGEEHRARIELPHGFEFRVAEMGDSVSWRTTAGDYLAMEHEHTYAQLARIDWRSDGSTR
jgi:hypothetical protein